MIKKKIIVTGSSRGIGYKIASNLEEEGHKVLFNGRKASKKKILFVEILQILKMH